MDRASFHVAGSRRVNAVVVGGRGDVSRETVSAELLLDVFGDRAGTARAYRDLLASKGLEWGLLGPRELDRLWSRHILNGAALAELIADDDVLVDVGSGAGLPGIPLALAVESLHVVLLEPLQRRARFLVETVDELGLADRVRVVRARAEQGAADPVDLGCAATVAVARAVAPLPRLIPLMAPLVTANGGRLLAVKGQRAETELKEAQAALRTAGVVHAGIRRAGARYLDPPATVVELTLSDR